MQVKVGTDIIRVERVEESIKKFGEKFLERFLSHGEIKRAKSVNSIAGYWAAKEAVAKALGCGIGKELGFLDIEIQKSSKGAPLFTLHGNRFNIESSSLSISHDGGFAVAVVAIVMKSKQN
ncbi:MAG TPA: holo-ACP synthase [Nitratifractor sp.]|nr:holo-ACP synthase [Nitratifractor sp.]